MDEVLISVYESMRLETGNINICFVDNCVSYGKLLLTEERILESQLRVIIRGTGKKMKRYAYFKKILNFKKSHCSTFIKLKMSVSNRGMREGIVVLVS